MRFLSFIDSWYVLMLLLIISIDTTNAGLRKRMKTPQTAEKSYSYLNVTPPFDEVRRTMIMSLRDEFYGKKHYYGDGCGILFALSSINGSTTNYHEMKTVAGGEAWYRLQVVIHEALSAASRIRNALSANNVLPDFCQKRVEISLFIDRDILSNTENDIDIVKDVSCVFDKIFYFDDLPSKILEKITVLKEYNRYQLLSRLPSRPNAMKLIAFLVSPYKYTLYLDGDIAPCPKFQSDVFKTLQNYDILSTPNPFGYESTRGAKTYLGSPPSNAFPGFPEINGGVFAFQMNNQTLSLFTRALELLPFMANLGYNQDQALMRHALFEMIFAFGLKMYRGNMHQYCRWGWHCDSNNCASGCLIIHQRKCLYLGVPVYPLLNATRPISSIDNCTARAAQFERRTFFYTGKYGRLNKENRVKGMAKVLGIKKNGKT